MTALNGAKLAVVVSVLTLVVCFVIPQVASANGIFDGPLVPECDYADEFFVGACQLCDLVSLVDNLINFAVAFSVIVATLMFTYAGFLYFTASASEGNIKKAHGVFGKVFVGLLIVLTAWLLIHTLLSVMSGKGLVYWGDIKCAEYEEGEHLDSLTGRLDIPVEVGSATASRYDPQAEAAMRQVLAGVCISASGSNSCSANPCTGSGTTGCTNVGGLQMENATKINRINGACKAISGCNLTLTGVSEGGHSAGSAHNRGDAADFRWDNELAQYLFDNRQSLGLSQICTPAGEAYKTYRYKCDHDEGQTHIHVGF
jgi:hypothetical protein